MKNLGLIVITILAVTLAIGCGETGGNTDAEPTADEPTVEAAANEVSPDDPPDEEQIPTSPELETEVSTEDGAAVAEERRTAVVDAAIEGCRIGADRYANQFSPDAVADLKNNECPRFGEWLAGDVQAAYEEIAAAEEDYYKDPTGDVWLDDRNVDYEGEVKAAVVDGCDHMVNLMEDRSWNRRFRSLTEDGFPGRFCFDLDS